MYRMISIFITVLYAALICFGCVTVYQKSERVQWFVRHINESEEYSRKWRKRLLLTLAVLSIAVVLILQVVPR